MKLFLLSGALLGAGLLLAWREPGPESAREHRVLSLRFAPIAGVAWLTAGALGWASRERLRRGTGHASPTAAWIAKRAAAVSLVAAAVYALSPVAWPAWALYLAIGTGAIAWGAYLSNLPLKL